MVDWSLELNARKGIEERVSQYTVAIDISIAAREPVHGTGFLVKSNKRNFIVTASHLIKPEYENENIGFLFKPDKELMDASKRQIKKIPLAKIPFLSKSYTKSLSIINRYYSEEEDDDIILLEIDPSSKESEKYEFYDLSLKGVMNPKYKKALYFIGFSIELTRQISRNGYGVFPYFLGSTLSRKRINCEDYNSKKHFLIEYEYDDNSVDPHGFSGGGVWTRLPSGKEKLWTPNIYLVGIQTGVLERSHLLKATKAERLEKVIKDNNLNN